MPNKYTGVVDVQIGDKKAKLVYDWAAIAEFQSTFGKEADINSFDIDQIATTLLIGLKRHNPEITKDDIFETSPAVAYISDCIAESFLYAQLGPEKAKALVEEARKQEKDVLAQVKKKTKTK